MKYFFVMLCIFVLSGCGASAPEVVNEPPEVKDAGVGDAEASASEEEEDMLDLAFDVSETSRLGCQITMTKDLDGLVVSLPAQHYNLMGD